MKISSEKNIRVVTTSGPLITSTVFVASSVCSGAFVSDLDDEDEVAGIVEYMKKTRGEILSH